MKYLIPGLTGLFLLCSTLLADAQSAGKGPDRPPIQKKPVPAAAEVPVAAGLTVPSWLPADAPLRPTATTLTDVVNTWLDVR